MCFLVILFLCVVIIAQKLETIFSVKNLQFFRFLMILLKSKVFYLKTSVFFTGKLPDFQDFSLEKFQNFLEFFPFILVGSSGHNKMKGLIRKLLKNKSPISKNYTFANM
jgi:predicted membrane channel-forming protein YqfA (hemolysin III family)